MALIRWEPVRERQTIQQEMNRLFGAFFDGSGNGQTVVARRWVPAVDLVEEGDHYVLRADLPGVGEDQVKVEVEDNVLTVSGERSSGRDEHRQGYHRHERVSGSFSRSLSLPGGVDPDSVEANYENGVLTVRIPKPEQRKPRRVAISVGGSAPEVEAAPAAGDTDSES